MPLISLRTSGKLPRTIHGNALKIAGVNCPSPGVASPPGCSNCGTRGFTLELTLIKNGSGKSALGPPLAPCALKSPAPLVNT